MTEESKNKNFKGVGFLSPLFWEKVKRIASEKGITLSDEQTVELVGKIAARYVKEHLNIDPDETTMLQFLKSIDDIITYDNAAKNYYQSNKIRKNIIANTMNSMNANFKADDNKRKIVSHKIPNHISSLDAVEEMILKNKRIETMHSILNQMKNLIDDLADNCTSSNEDFDIIISDLNSEMNSFLSEHSKYVDEEVIRSLLRSLDNSNKNQSPLYDHVKLYTSTKKDKNDSDSSTIVIPHEIADIMNMISQFSGSSINEKIEEFLKNPRIRFE